MAIKTNVKDISVIIDPLSFMSDIEVLAGSPVQTYNEDSKQYESDRRVLPCVIIPSVSAWDHDKTIGGKQSIATCEWYEGAPLPDGRNRIIAGDDYELSPAGYPKNALKVKKNISPSTPMEYHAVFTFVDTRKSKEVKSEKSIAFYTSFYDSKAFALRIENQPAGWVIDPLRVKETNGKWIQTITAQLYSGSKAVPDTNAAYFWDVIEDGVAREITQDELDIFISGKDAQGNWGKTLTFDAKFIRNMTFRCRACFFKDTRPTIPTNSSLKATSAVNVEFPKTLRAEVRQVAGARVNASLSTNVIFECVLYDNTAQVPASKNSLFSIIWKAASGKPGTSQKVIGKGRNISFSPSSLGFDKNYSIAVYADVKLYAVTALVTSNNKVLTSGGKVVTASKYE